jgi:peptidoglycan glycosyltransferase
MIDVQLVPDSVARRPSFRESVLLSHRSEVLLAVAALFVFANAAGLSLVLEGQLALDHFVAPAVWLGLFGGAIFLLRRYLPVHDPFLLPVVALLTGWGLIMLDRLAANFLWRQVIWLALSVGALTAAAVLPRDLRLLYRFRYTLLLVGLALLLATLVMGVNPSGQGAALWLRVPLLGRVYFQPSELLKLLLIIFLASYLDERGRLFRLTGTHGRLGQLPYLAPLLLMWGFSILILIWQRDLGAATLFFVVFLTMLYVATGEWRYVAASLLLLAAAGAVGYLAFDVVELRVDMWINPWLEATGRGFQIAQSIYAVAAGGIMGQGVGQGFPTYIPVVHTDFAFAAVAEEWGLVGGLAVLFAFALIGYRAVRIAALSRQPFRAYLAAGIAALFAIQSLLIMGGVTKLVPLTGVTLPFVSYGGSSLPVSSLMIGLLLKLSADAGRSSWEKSL